MLQVKLNVSRRPNVLLDLAMEVEEDIGSYHPYLSNVTQNTNEDMLTCSKCDYTTLGEKDLSAHNQMFHSSPSCGACAPSCWGSCGREANGTQTSSTQIVNNPQAPTVNQGPRGPQSGGATPAIDCRLLNHEGFLRQFWTCTS